MQSGVGAAIVLKGRHTAQELKSKQPSTHDMMISEGSI